MSEIAFVVMKGNKVDSVFAENPALTPDAEPRARERAANLAISGQDELQESAKENAVWVARVELNP
jgi:hypothetical protein